MRQPLPQIFQKYAGVEIPNENSRPTADGEKIMNEISQIAADNNIKMRFNIPGMIKTMDWQPDRVNIALDQDWVIQDQCTYG